MKLAQLIEIKEKLETIGKLKLPIWYEIAKNLKAVNKVLDEANELRMAIWEKFADKDEAGKVKEYIGEKGTPEEGKPYSKITDKAVLAECMAELKNMDDDDTFEVKFHRILKDRISQKDLEGGDFVPLIDVIVVETPADLRGETPKEPKAA